MFFIFLISALKYCTDDSKLCADIQSLSFSSKTSTPDALTVVLDFEASMSAVLFAVGPSLDNTNLFIFTTSTPAVIPRDSQTKSMVNLSSSDFIVESKIMGDRVQTRFTKSLKTPFFTSKIALNGWNTFTWGTFVSNSNKTVESSRFKLSSLGTSGYAIDESPSSKSHGYLMILAFYVFLSVSILVRKFGKSSGKFKRIYYTSEFLMWLMILTAFIVIVVAKKDSAIVSSHAITSVVFIVIFLFIRLFRVVFTLHSFDFFNLAMNPRIPTIYLFIDIAMLIITTCIGLGASLNSFSFVPYISTISVFILSVLIATGCMHRANKTNKSRLQVRDMKNVSIGSEEESNEGIGPVHVKTRPNTTPPKRYSTQFIAQPSRQSMRSLSDNSNNDMPRNETIRKSLQRSIKANKPPRQSARNTLNKYHTQNDMRESTTASVLESSGEVKTLKRNIKARQSVVDPDPKVVNSNRADCVSDIDLKLAGEYTAGSENENMPKSSLRGSTRNSSSRQSVRKSVFSMQYYEEPSKDSMYDDSTANNSARESMKSFISRNSQHKTLRNSSSSLKEIYAPNRASDISAMTDFSMESSTDVNVIAGDFETSPSDFTSYTNTLERRPKHLSDEYDSESDEFSTSRTVKFRDTLSFLPEASTPIEDYSEEED